MKELSGTASNRCLVEGNKAFIPMVELIFVVTEPQFRFEAGEMVRDRKPETIRIHTNRSGTKALIKLLMECDKAFDLLDQQAAAAELTGEAKSSQPTKE
jgi:hypothetical protein